MNLSKNDGDPQKIPNNPSSFLFPHKLEDSDKTVVWKCCTKRIHKVSEIATLGESFVLEDLKVIDVKTIKESILKILKNPAYWPSTKNQLRAPKNYNKKSVPEEAQREKNDNQVRYESLSYCI